MKLRNYKKIQDGGLPKGEKLKIKNINANKGKFVNLQLKLKIIRIQNILQMLMSYMNYMLKRLSKLCQQDPGLHERLCISDIWYPDCSSMYLHSAMFSHTDYLLKFIVNYEDFEPNMFQQHHKIEYHCFV